MQIILYEFLVCQKCIFPFEYEGELYNDCAPMGRFRICAFEVNEHGEMVLGRYKICPYNGCNETNLTDISSTLTTLGPNTNQTISTAHTILPCNWFHTGNGFCEDENNHPACNYDGGDCCVQSPHIVTVNTTYCTTCMCYPESVTTTHGRSSYLKFVRNKSRKQFL